MPFAVHLFFDIETEQQIRQLWQELALTNIAPYMHHSNNRPHLSLAIFDQIDLTSSAAQLEQMAETFSSFPITFSHFGLFHSKEGVVFVAPIVTIDLLAIHTHFHQHYGNFGTNSHRYYLPGFWVPHCTLALGVALDKKLKAVELIHQLQLPLQGHVTELGLIEFRPVKHLMQLSLRKG